MPERDQLLSRLHAEYDGTASDAYLELYESEPPELAVVYASFHQRINNLLNFMNSKIYGSGGGHFNADPSREFIALLQELQEKRAALKRVGINVEIRPDYKKILDACETFLVSSGGSTIPDSFGRVPLERYEAVISTAGPVAPRRGADTSPKLTMVGEGSFVLVHKFRDPVLDRRDTVLCATPRARRFHRPGARSGAHPVASGSPHISAPTTVTQNASRHIHGWSHALRVARAT